MPPPSRLLKRIETVRPCGACGGLGDWLVNEQRGGMKRCSCLRGRLLQKADQMREGKQVEQTELELQ